ncbi:DMT family transporter [Spirillospora sp. NBC_01491]|uniref:DMT family transporter n=1 Tax=Spirillospora sp. NBC_01491 TaxID=2976007 RepID=UPI002E339E7C|nr:DMT family transporter [Spirillospora sp. NBC_01491]
MTRPTNPRGTLGAATAMTCVGSLTAVSATIAGYPVFGGQAVRYAVAALILFLVARFAARDGRRTRPTPREWAYLTALAATGLVAFNVCIVLATRDTGPATIGTVIATVPIVMALAGPLLERRRPAPAVVVSACVVTAGAALANGLGGGTARGLLLSLGALGGEVCFSLLAVPVLPRLGPLRVSAYSAAIAAPMLLVTGLVADGRGVLRVPTGPEFAGLAYLSVVVTSIAFLIWYDALGRLGADRAGLFAGLIPVSAVATTMALGLGRPSAADLAGAGLVAAGVVIGVRSPRPAAAPAPEPVPEPVEAGAPEGGRTL